MTQTRETSGTTLFEMAAVLMILSIGLLSSMSVLDRSEQFTHEAASRLRTKDSGRRVLDSLVDLVHESSMRFMDTATRVHNGGTATDYLSDRFVFPSMGFVQCLSPVCRFHTRGGVVPAEDRLRCGLEYRRGTATTGVARGKIWPEVLKACPLDGSPVSPLTTFDILKFFSARSVRGQFITDVGSGPEPDWRNLVFVAPYVSGPRRAELRQYTISVDDLLAGVVTSSGDSPFDATPPDMIDLFDFGSDGTTDGIPDGSVPVVPEKSDADTDSFFLGTMGSEPAIVVSKTLGDASNYPWRTVMLTVRLRDGWTSITVDHHETATVFWSASRSFVRKSRSLISELSEFAVSTAATDPFNAVTNPDGVKESGVVRITIATTHRITRSGEKAWTHNVVNLDLKPRN